MILNFRDFGQTFSLQNRYQTIRKSYWKTSESRLFWLGFSLRAKTLFYIRRILYGISIEMIISESFPLLRWIIFSNSKTEFKQKKGLTLIPPSASRSSSSSRNLIVWSESIPFSMAETDFLETRSNVHRTCTLHLVYVNESSAFVFALLASG